MFWSTTGPMNISGLDMNLSVNSESILYGSNDQLKIGWTNNGIWQLFDKDSMRITFGDVNNDIGGYQYGFDVVTGEFFVSGNLNTFAGGMSQPSMESSTGGGHLMANGFAGLYYDPSVVESSVTIDLPVNPVNGQMITIYFGGIITTGDPVITSFTLNPGANFIIGSVPSGINSGDVLKFKYRANNTTWYRDN